MKLIDNQRVWCTFSLPPGRMVGAPKPSHLQHPSQKLNFVFEVSDAGLVGGNHLL